MEYESKNTENKVKYVKKGSIKSINKTVTNQPKKRRRPVTNKVTKKKIKSIRKDENEKLQEDFPSKTPRPQYFENVLLLLEDNVRSRHMQLVRDFVAHGGTIVHKWHKQYATHILHLYDEVTVDKIDMKQSVNIVIEWIKDTIEKGVLQDDRPYRVRLISKKEVINELM